MHVALFGGSFNPPHVGHLLATHYVYSTQEVDEVWWMPAWNHPFGKTLESFEHRVEMCRQIAKDASGWFKVSEVEREVGGEGRTVDTLAFLHKRFPEHRFTLVIGSDIVKDLPKWKEFDRVQQLARVLVLYRAGHPEPGAVGPPLAEVSSTEVREL
ncbi:MAG: nicotinate (nicotinamide) nucleotide adenylyltransferase, partial [Myxococcaceae bacterium]